MWVGQIGALDNAWGNSLYTASGAASSAKAQLKNQMKLQKDAQEFSKWQMANAHQMEVQDLQNAGLNPVLSAGGQGASAGVTEGSASAGAPVIDPISAVSQIVGTMNTAKQTNATIKNLQADTGVKNAETIKTLNEAGYTNEMINNAIAERAKIYQEIKESKSREDLNKAQTKLAKWNEKHALLNALLGSLGGGVLGIASSVIMGNAIKQRALKGTTTAKVKPTELYLSSPNVPDIKPIY